MAEGSALLQEQQQQPTTTMAAPPPPRRARVREVSSRFMSPIVSSSSSGDLHLPASKCPLPKHAISTSTELQSRHPHNHHQLQQRSQSVQRRHQELEPLGCADENRLETVRSLDTPLASHSKLVLSMQRKQKLFKENGGRGEQLNNGKFPVRNGNLARSRPDTPIVISNPRSIISTQRSINMGVASVASTAAAKLVQSSGMAAHTSASEVASSISVNSSNLDSDNEGCAENSTSNVSSEAESRTVINRDAICNSPSIQVQSCKTRHLPECRSSMPEADLLPTMSARLQAERSCSGGNAIGDSSKITASSPFYRSLNSPLSSCEQSFSSPTKSIYKSTSVLSKPHPSSLKSGGICLPPHPSNIKLGTEVARKGRKVLSHQEDVHALRMLHNRYLQWRYANAKAEIAMNTQRITAERSLYALMAKISELCDSVKGKRTELGKLKKTGILSTILEAQVPYLDEWSALEGDYSSSMSEAIKALKDASLRLPITGNVRADIREVDGALKSASNMMDIMSSHVESFFPKAEEMDTLISELAGVASRERALIEECGDLLSLTHMLQVEECSLRGQLIQLKQSSFGQAREE